MHIIWKGFEKRRKAGLGRHGAACDSILLGRVLLERWTKQQGRLIGGVGPGASSILLLPKGILLSMEARGEGNFATCPWIK